MDVDSYKTCDTMIVATIAAACAMDEGEKKLVMETIERYGITGEWFTNAEYRAYFEAAEAYWKREHTLDAFLIMNAFSDRTSYLSLYERLLEHPVVGHHIEHYCKELKKRRIYEVAHKALTETLARLHPDMIGVQLEDFVKRIHELQEDYAEGDEALKQLGAFMSESMAKKEKLHQERFVNKNWEYLDGLRMPWKEVDQIFSGLKTGLHIIAALASQGKSTMAVDISVFWNEIGIKHGFFSIDMAADQLADRYPCVVNRVSLAKMNFGASHTDLERFRDGFSRSVRLNNVWLSEIDDAKTMEYQCYRGVKTLGWQAIIIDYIQLVHCDERSQMPEYTRVQHAVQAVKRIAKSLKVPVICLAQLSRAFEQQLREKGFAPGLDAIGDSAEIARAAASVTCLYQDEDVKKYWAEHPPVMLAFADPKDMAYQCGFADPATEDPRIRDERRMGQVSLAKQLRPVWFDVKKNQQGRCGKIPFVMFPNYFLFRPGNSDGEKSSVTVGGKEKMLPTGMFEQLRDDWTFTEQDWWLEMTGAIPQRGVKLMGETYEQFKSRLERERARHPEVAHFVEGVKIEAKE